MGRLALSLLLLAAPCTAASFVPVTPSRPSPQWPAPAARGDALLREVALQLHNRARRDFGVPPVRWSEMLAGEAKAYAEKMAATGVYAHDTSTGRRAKMGENLWRGQKGVFSYEVMLGLMVDERRHFRPGVFPDVSRTGEWHDVAHWTQMVWPSTTEIGCAVASSAATDYLVCRYAPTGNKDGVALGPGVSTGAVQMADGAD